MSLKKPEKTHKACSKCEENKQLKSYYLASDKIIHSDGRLSICKTCLDELVDMFVPETLVEVLRKIDRPFIKTEYVASLSMANPFKEYMRRLAMRHNINLTYKDSMFDDDDFSKYKVKTINDLNKSYDVEDVVSFKVTPEIIAKWGSGYSETDLFRLEQFYSEMKQSNDITTPQHLESLKLLCKLNLKQNNALDSGDSSTFAKLNTQYNKILQDSGFRPIDRQSSGESAGIRTFSQIWEEVEKEGFIEPYPYKESQDIVDRTIMYMGNYTRKLLNFNSMTEPPEDTPKVDGDDDEL